MPGLAAWLKLSIEGGRREARLAFEKSNAYLEGYYEGYADALKEVEKRLPDPGEAP